MTDEKRNAQGHQKTMRFTDHEWARVGALAKERGISRSQLLGDMTDDFLDDRLEVDTYETRKRAFSYPRDRAEAAEAKARALGMSLRDVLRSAVEEVGRG